MQESRIWILPEFLASQIAAGEVVQRPESVVKELVENALDAEATTVAVTVHAAGRRLIHVVDDGYGMSRSDLALSIRRHATSKLRELEDLHRIATLGFRGEALAAIAAVSHLEIRTRQADDPVGWRLLSEPDTEPRIEPYAGEKGTQVLVRNLFYNVPARRKFLRSDLTEFRLIADTMTRFVLGHPPVRFLFSDERALIFDVAPGTLQERFAALFGDELVQKMLPVESAYAGFRVWGFVGHPECARPSRAQQFLFLNRRWIQHRGLSHAVYTAYEQLLESGTYPIFVLHIEVDPEQVDVNVHPQKHEVKFEEERQAFTAVLQAVTEALGRSHLAPTVTLGMAQTPMTVERTAHGQPLLVNRITGEVVAPEQIQPRRWQLGGSGSFPVPAYRQATRGTAAPQNAATVLFQEELQLRCWQVHDTYIFWETPEGIRIVDQHVAHERVLYERFRRVWEAERKIPQRLLLPLPLSLESAQRSLVEELWEPLHELGFELQRASSGAMELAAVPADIPPGQEDTVLMELLEGYREYSHQLRGSAVERLLATLACKAAVKAGQTLSEPEIHSLIAELQHC
ncbi:MAG: DNA mismatch repair endonuclease MutL, partial [Bacteroidota bacterium]|nr:DNA mismatch repair endonuclease MutL [Bacteroidota bacterium]